MRALFAGLAAGLFVGPSLAARTIEIQNACSYTVFPAISSLAGDKEAYNGDHGWESPSGSTKSIAVPDAWNGRIWGRHGCVKSSDGTTVDCVTGGCVGNKLQCGDNELGGAATSAEFRLQSQANGQVDMYDLQNGGGWGVPIGIKPQSGCDGVSCTPTLSTCPDARLMLKDSYGNILGCNSACYAGIGDSNVQCCKGDYASPQTCTPDKIQFYSYFKAGCKNAYAYFQDSPAGGDETGFVCKSSGDAGFTVIFCPDGDGDSAGSQKGGKTSKASSSASATHSGDVGKTGSQGQPSGTGAPTASQSASTAISTGAAGANMTVSSASGIPSTTDSSSDTGASAVPTATDPAATDSTPAGSATADEANASSSAGASTSSPTSLSKPVIFAIGGGILLIAVLGVGIVCFISRRKNKRDTASNAAAAQGQSRGSGKPPPGSDEEATAASEGRNPAQGYNALGKASRRRSRSGLLSSSASGSESDDSFFSSSEDEERPARRRASLASARSSRSARSGRSGR